VDLRVRVRRARASSIGASASGEWRICEKSYKVNATITEKDGERSGSILVEGLGFTAQGSLVKGNARLDACEDEAQKWVKDSGASMSARDATNVVAVGLEILTKERVKGVADVDVPEVLFDLLRSTLGLSNLDQLECSTEVSHDDAEDQESNDDEDSKDGEDSDEAGGEENENFDDARAENVPAARPREEWKVVVEEEESKDAEQENGFTIGVGSWVEVAKGFCLTGEGTKLQKGWKGLVEAIDGDGNAFISFCDGRKGEWVSPEDFEQLSELEAQSSHEEKNVSKVDDADVGGVDADDVADETLFVSQRMMASIKGKLAKGTVPTHTDITKLLDTSTLTEDEELVSLDVSILGIPSLDLLSSKQAAAEWTAAFVKKHGLKSAAELCVKAELDEENEEEDEEEEEEEECEEEENGKELEIEDKGKGDGIHSLGGIAKKNSVQQGKRVMPDKIEEEARNEPGRKRLRARAGA